MKRFCLLASMLAVLASPVAANAKTTVSVSGMTATITVPVDVGGIGGAHFVDPDTGKQTTPAEYWTRGADAVWNGGFARYRYHDCVTFKLDLQIYAAKQSYDSGWKVDGTAGHHHIAVTDLDSRPYVDDPSAKSHNDDTTSAYTSDLGGVWTQQESNVTAHEVGHLMGLGDDYSDAPAGGPSVPLAGRAGTLMAGSEHPVVDQNLVDRLGKLMEKAGIKLPQCWTGTIESNTSRTYVEGIYGGNTHCTDHWHAMLRFVIADGKIEGNGEARPTAQASCYVGVGKPAMLEAFGVQGTATDQELTLQLAFESVDGVVLAGWSANVARYNGTHRPAPIGPPIVVPLVDPCTAKGTVTVHDTLPSGGKLDPLTAVDTIELKCPKPGST